MDSISSPPQSRRPDPILALIVIVAGVLGALLVSKARNWAVMTDELLYTGMARAIAHSGLPLAQIRGESVNVNQVLYPSLIAGLVAPLKMPAAYPWIAAMNAAIFATAAIPAYLLASFTTASRAAARWVAACSVVTPWIIFASKALPDPTAYVTVLWAAYAIARTAAGTRRPIIGDLLTLVAIVVAYFARNQFLLLAGVWPAVVVGSCAARAIAEAGPRSIPRALLRLPLARPLPFVAFLAVVLVVKLEPHWLLGVYAVTATGARGGTAPSGIVHAIFNHISVLAVALAGIPVVLGLPWLLVALTRVRERAQNDAAITILLLAGAIIFVGASFDMRFTESDRVIERYIFYAGPLALVAMAGFFTAPPKRLLAFVIPAIAGILVLNVSEPYGLDAPITYAVNHTFSPTQVVLIAYQNVADVPGLSIYLMLAVLLAIWAALAYWLVSTDRAGIALNASFALLLVVFAASTAWAVPKLVRFQNSTVDQLYGHRTAAQKTWVDVASGGKPVSLVYAPRLDVASRAVVKPAERTSNWWDLAFWNESIAAVYLPLSGNPTAYSPLPGAAHTMKADWPTGELERWSGDDSSYLLLAASNPFFAPQFTGTPTWHSGYVLYDTGPHATAAWATQGLTARGWVPPSGATLRVYAPARATSSSPLQIALSVASPGGNPEANGFKVKGASDLRSASTRGRTVFTWRASVPAAGHLDFRLVRGEKPAHIAGASVTSSLD